MKISNRIQIHATYCIKFRNREHIACLYSALFLYFFGVVVAAMERRAQHSAILLL